ncbi:MAG: hypothetical protein OXG64_01885 [Chloroflexi bacterium]|nr:hypothetical protein [Chloroflexota bacterium]
MFAGSTDVPLIVGHSGSMDTGVPDPGGGSSTRSGGGFWDVCTVILALA